MTYVASVLAFSMDLIFTMSLVRLKAGRRNVLL